MEQGKILWLIQTIHEKFEKYCKRSFDITHRLEYMQRNLWNKVIRYVAQDKVKNPAEYIEKINEKMFPWENVVKMMLQDSQMRKSHAQMMLEKRLHQSIYGLNRIKQIKQQMVENNLNGVVDEFIKN